MKNILKFPERRRIDSEAAEWLVILDRHSSPNADELALLKEWLERSPAHATALNEAAALWGQMNVLTKLAVDIEPHKTRPSRSPTWNMTTVGIAASVLAALGSLMFAIDTSMSVEKTNGFYATAVGDQWEQELQDGSIIFLNTNSQVEVAFSSEHRDIYLLQGEAHFTVAHNPQLPFRVFAGDGVINAVGTAFSVHLLKDSVDVVVTDGKVSLASTGGRPPLPATGATQTGDAGIVVEKLGLLEAGQIATIVVQDDGQSNAISSLDNVQSVGLERVSDRLSWREGMLSFSGQPLEEVVERFSRYTTIRIELANATVRETRVGGTFPVGETEMMLAALETNFGLDVTWVSRDRVLVSDR